MLGALKLLVLRACACARVRVCVFICLISFYFPCPWKCRNTALRDRAVDELVLYLFMILTGGNSHDLQHFKGKSSSTKKQLASTNQS